MTDLRHSEADCPVNGCFVCMPPVAVGIRAEKLTALYAVEHAARELDALFGGEGPGRWTLAGEPIKDGPVTDCLLSLHDYLNDMERTRRT